VTADVLPDPATPFGRRQRRVVEGTEDASGGSLVFVLAAKSVTLIESGLAS